jgi:hypothetical protein
MIGEGIDLSIFTDNEAGSGVEAGDSSYENKRLELASS